MRTVLLEETVVVVHLQLTFNLAHGIERNTDHDENRGTAERLNELVTAEVEDDRSRSRAPQRQPSWTGKCDDARG